MFFESNACNNLTESYLLLRTVLTNDVVKLHAITLCQTKAAQIPCQSQNKQQPALHISKQLYRNRSYNGEVLGFQSKTMLIKVFFPLKISKQVKFSQYSKVDIFASLKVKQTRREHHLLGTLCTLVYSRLPSQTKN